MNAKCAYAVTTALASLVLMLGSSVDAFSQITTNGNGGSTDVGMWYGPLNSLTTEGEDSWSAWGMNL
jgi:hypothetical protein